MNEKGSFIKQNIYTVIKSISANYFIAEFTFIFPQVNIRLDIYPNKHNQNIQKKMVDKQQLLCLPSK